MPKLATVPGFVRAVVGDWQANGLVTARSGMPFSILIGRDTALSGTTNQRPNVVGAHRLPTDRPRQDTILAWFNRGACAEPGAGTCGDAGRNPLLGPPAVTTNLGLFKNLPISHREGLRLQFRSEFFNLFNSVSLGNPNNQLAAGDRMGRITSADQARVIQFVLKLIL